MEKEIRIQDDLYEYVNHEWLEKAVIPDDKPTAGGFSDLATNVEELLMGEFKKMNDREWYATDMYGCIYYENVNELISKINTT